MRLSIKQKQVVGLTSIVILLAVSLSALQLFSLTGALLAETRARGELIAQTIFHLAQNVVVTSEATAYQDLRWDTGVRAVLEASLYSGDVAYAAIVNSDNVVIAHSDARHIGDVLRPAADLKALADAGGITQLRAIYQTERMLELRQPMLLGETPFGELRVGMTPLIIRSNLYNALWPAALAAAIAVGVAVLVAVVLAQVVVRPIHVIRSSLSRLGKGDLAAKIDLEGEEFKDLGDVFASVTNQLQAATTDRFKRKELLDLSKRVTALGRLTAGVAHEVKNPLNAMTIHLELLKQKLATNAPSDACASNVEVIGREIRRLDEVVQGFLKFARPEELSLRPVSPAALLDEVLKTLAVEANVTGVVLDRAIGHDVPDIEADDGILRQALLNLARNALQAMPGGGRLQLSCTTARDGRVEIRVSDTGVGIAPEDLPRIFDLYFTTKESGTGIGLSLVYRTVQMHSGDIDVESTPGKGTAFIIKLPRAHPTAEAVTPIPRHESERLRRTS
jgi:signal transduction histidine kinase